MLEGSTRRSLPKQGPSSSAFTVSRAALDAYLVDIHLSENRLERGGIEFIKQVRNIQAAPSVVVTASVEMQTCGRR